LWKLRPFAELNVGAVRLGVGCNTGNAGNACGSISAGHLPTLPPGVTIIVPPNPNATGFSSNVFAMTVGGGFDIKLSKRLAWRVVQAEYLYTRFGNGCQFAYCSGNNGQNSVRLNSGIVLGWGGQ
jgi:opacity protein-like surface antigen